MPLSSPHLPAPTEHDPLIATAPRIVKKPFYRPRPLWLVPFALIASLTRGITVASRVEVFTHLSCTNLQEYNHTHLSKAFTPFHPIPIHSLHVPPSSTYDQFIPPHDDSRAIPSKSCVSDPVVQAGAARLQTIMTTTMGALSALTTGWWSQFGERHGRTRILAITTFGLFLTDLIFILVSTPHSPLAIHAHKLLILAPIIEGSLGGWSTLSGACTAYMADCTSPGSRATIFARFNGVIFVGLALGPVFGAWLIKNPTPFLKLDPSYHPLQSATSVFGVAAAFSFLNLLLVLFVFPESLSPSRRASNTKRKVRAVDDGLDFIGTKQISQGCPATHIIQSFLSPLSVFLPAHVPVAASANGDSLTPSRTRKDWSLTFIGLSLFLYMLASGVFQLKYLFAEHIYDWAAEELSYYISFMGACRAWHLLVFLPFLLSKLKSGRTAVSSSNLSNIVALDSKPIPTKSHLLSEMKFDIRIIRYSMLVDCLSHAMVVFAPLPSRNTRASWWSQFMFVAATSLSCAGTGILPSMQSLTLCTVQGRALATKTVAIHSDEAEEPDSDAELGLGKLFGALNVVSTIGQAILGPMVFGIIYSSTIASFPKAIFATAGGLVLLSTALTMLIRPDVSLSMTQRKPIEAKGGSNRNGEENRGRSRVSKDLRGGAARAASDVSRFNASGSTGAT